MTIYPLSGASWPAKQQSSSAVEEAAGYGRRREMQTLYSSCRGSPRQWELRKVASCPVVDADYWSDASLSLPHLASNYLPHVGTEERVSAVRCLQSEEARPAATHESSYTQKISSRAEERVKATRRGGVFPPPLDSPALSEGRYCHLQTLEKVCFTSVRSNGRLLVTEMPVTVQPRRHLRSQRRNGRLLLQLHVESSSSARDRPPVEEEGEEELEDPSAVKDNPIAEEGTSVNPNAQKSREQGEFAKKASPAMEQLVEEGAGGEEEGGGKFNNDEVKLYTKVLRTLECDSFSDSTIEAASSPPIQLHLKYGRSTGVASFLHKSLTRVRPLSIWQS